MKLKTTTQLFKGVYRLLNVNNLDKSTYINECTVNLGCFNFLYIILAFPLLLFFSTNRMYAQTNLYTDPLNNSVTNFTLSGGSYYSSTSGASDGPASSNFYSEGTYSYGVSNATATLTSSTLNTSSYSSVNLTFRLASFSIGSTGNGADAGDIVTVEISPDNGVTYYSTLRVLGPVAANAYWSFNSGTGIASTSYDGNSTPVDFQPSATGARTSDGYSYISISSLPSTNNLKIRITLLNNAAGERWLIDDIKVIGFTNYRSKTTGNWASTSTWESSTDGTTWAAASSTPTSSDGTITILNGHTVTVAASVSADQVTVNSGGTLAVSSGQTLTVADGSGTDLTVDGSLTNTGTITTTGTVTIAGTYNHTQNGGTIPTATWSSGSTCNVTGITSTAPVGGLNQSFHHFTWNCTGQTIDVNLNASPTWGGDFTVSSTGTKVFSVSSGAGSYTLTVSGNVSISGGILTLTTGASSGGGLLNITGNLSVSSNGKLYTQSANYGGTLTVTGNVTTSGTATFMGADLNYNSNSTWNLYGNVDISTGTVGARSGSSNSGFTTINLYGASKTFKLPTSSMVYNENAFWFINIKNAASVTLQSDVYSGKTVTVENGGTLDMVTYIAKSMTGNTFVTQSGSTLKTANVDGLTSSGATGSVQTATRTLNGGATYEYNGSLAQNTGNGLVTPITGTLKINNAAGVTLTQATTVSGTLNLTSGLLTTTSSLYLLVSGSISTYSSSSYIKGPLRRQFTATASPYTGNDYFFPIGDASNYSPFELNSVNCTTGAQIEVTMSSTGASTVDGSMASVGARNWFLDWINPSATLTSGVIRLTESSLGASNVIGKSTTQSGNYTSVGGASIGSTISSNGAVTISSTDTYFAIGTICTSPTTQATSFTTSNLGTTTVTLGWTRGSGSGVLVVVSTSATMTDPTDGTTYTGNSAFGSATALGAGKIVYVGSGNTVDITGLSANTPYYFAAYEYSSTKCYNSTELTGSISTYCVPSSTSSSTYISNFSTTSGLTNISNLSSGYSTSGYGNFSSTISASQYASSAVNFSLTLVGGTAGIGIWIDWNDNGLFTDLTESVYNSAAYMSTGITTGSFTVPSGAAIGSHRMRVIVDYSITTPTSCVAASISRGEAEDYTFTVVALALPTITSFTPSSGCVSTGTITITGTNFTGTPTVSIGGTAATGVIVNSSTSITATVGNGTTGTVSVTTAGGTATSSSTYTVNPLPTLSYSGSPYTYSQNTAISTLTPTLGNSPTTFSVSPALPTGISLNTSTGVISGTPSSPQVSTSYTITASNSNCSTTTSISINILPSNDLCSSASILTVDAAASAGSLENSNFTSPFTSYNDVWYQFTPSCTSNHTITLSGFTGDKDLEVFSACGTTTTLNSSTSETSTETITQSFTSSTTYYIRVYNYSGANSTFTISVTGYGSTAPTITNPSTSSQNVCLNGGTFSQLSVTGSGTGISYQWQESANGTSGWAPVASSGTSSTYTPSNSVVGTKYFRCIVTNCGGSATSNASGSMIVSSTPTAYYSASTGNLNSLSSWGSNTDGTGCSPVNFTTASITYYITNRTTATIGAAWTVSGASSKVVLGQASAAAVTFTIPNNYAFTGTIDIAAASSGSNTLVINNTSIPTFGTLNAASTVKYNAANSQTISVATYGNLETGVESGTSNYTKTVAGILDINGNLTIGDYTTLNLSTYSHTLAGHMIKASSNSTFTATAGTITFDGTSTQHINVVDPTAATITPCDADISFGNIIVNGSNVCLWYNKTTDKKINIVDFTVNNGKTVKFYSGPAVP